jgi:hypothetical protein
MAETITGAVGQEGVQIGALKNWANESRPRAEMNARAEIMSSIKKDIRASEKGYPRFLGFAVGDPTSQAQKTANEVFKLLYRGGPNVTDQPALKNFPDFPVTKTGYQEVEVKDSVTGEVVRVRMGEEAGTYYAQEVGVDGRLISRAEIRSDHQAGYTYHLELHSGGGLNINSDSLPQATLTTFGLLMGVVDKELKKAVKVGGP